MDKKNLYSQLITHKGGDYMGGSIHQKQNSNKWFISVYWESQRYRIFRHPVTKEPFYSKQSAQKQLSKIQTEVDEGFFNPKTWFPDSPLSIQEYSKKWLKVISVSEVTLDSYRTGVNKYIIPFFGFKDIRRVRYNDIVEFKNWLSGLGLKSKTIYNTINIFKKLMRDAWYNEDISRVPPFPKISYDKPKITYLTIEQQEELLNAISERHRPIFIVMMEYGLRPQEARALKKDAIKKNSKGNFERIDIFRVFSKDKLKETTKTGDKGLRTFIITPRVIEALTKIPPKISSKILHSEGGKGGLLSPFIFTREDGRPYRNRDLNKIWHEAEEKTGIKCKLYNAVRHSLGCQLLDEGVEMDIVRQMYGHTNMEMTRRYAERKITKLDKILLERNRKVIQLKKRK